ncbi:MAG: DinB family protein [Planctomycetota bacterium]
MSPQSQSTQGTTAALIEDNLVILGQACDLVARVDNARYAQPHPDLGLSSIGSHLRHILDFYSLFLGAMQRFDGGEAVPVLDYDRRERRPAIETDAEQGALALRDIRAALEQRLGGPWPAALRVQTDSLGCKHAPQSDSSVERELQAMLSHTVHHYALIKIAAGRVGIDPGREFGVAPSTLRYWEQVGTCAP